MDARIVLIDPKYPHNIGAAIRAASCFGASQVIWSGERSKKEIEAAKRIPREERMKGYKEVELLWNNYPLADSNPENTVCIELLPGTVPLTEFVHPDNATYVFGPEDGSVPKGIRTRCKHFVHIPSHHCLNLSASVYVVLYDRMIKSGYTLELLETRGAMQFLLEN